MNASLKTKYYKVLFMIRRNVQRNLDPICLYSHNCVVDFKKRKSCASCRFLNFKKQSFSIIRVGPVVHQAYVFGENFADQCTATLQFI